MSIGDMIRYTPDGRTLSMVAAWRGEAGPLDPFGGVSLEQVRASLKWQHDWEGKKPPAGKGKGQ